MAGPHTPGSRGRRTAIVAVAVAALLLLVLVGLGAAGGAAHRRSFDPNRPLEQRVTDAQTAHRLAPWNASYGVREFAMVNWLKGGQLLDAGDYSGAVNVLREAYRRDVGEQELLALFQRAQEIETLATNRKAHLQHGHEGPGSSLRPQDVER